MLRTTSIQEKVQLPILERFLRMLGDCAEEYKWKLVPYGSRMLIRAVVDKQLLCPVQVVAYHRSGKTVKDREIPSNSARAGLANLTNAGDVCIVHNADELETSRYYRPEIREHLLKLTGLAKKDEPEVADIVSVNTEPAISTSTKE